jgi:hypothetical protein
VGAPRWAVEPEAATTGRRPQLVLDVLLFGAIERPRVLVLYEVGVVGTERVSYEERTITIALRVPGVIEPSVDLAAAQQGSALRTGLFTHRRASSRRSQPSDAAMSCNLAPEHPTGNAARSRTPLPPPSKDIPAHCRGRGRLSAGLQIGHYLGRQSSKICFKK